MRQGGRRKTSHNGLPGLNHAAISFLPTGRHLANKKKINR